MAFLALARGTEAINGEGNHAKATELANQHPSNYLPEFSLQQAMQEEKWLQEKISHFPFHFNGPEEVPSSAETPQSTTEIHQNKDKGKEPLALNEEKMASLRVLIEKAKTDPEIMGRARKLLADIKGQSSDARRRLDNQPVNCLDVSASDLATTVVDSLADTGVPGSVMQTSYFPNVKNNCPVASQDTTYTVTIKASCNDGASSSSSYRRAQFKADPYTVIVGENAGGSISTTYAGCMSYVDDKPVSCSVPSSLEIDIYADGVGKDTAKSVYSQTQTNKIV